MADIELLAIEGLDAAIVGTAVINGRDVLAYDYKKTVEILVSAGHSDEYAEEWIAEVASIESYGAPAFVYFENDKKFYGSSVPRGTTIH